MIINRINRFWAWFLKHNESLAPEKISNIQVNQLNKKIISLGDFSWEIREGNLKDNMLIISPGGDLELLDKAKDVINKAPDFRNWELHYYKPPKKWDFKFLINNNLDSERNIDVGNWQYVLLKYDDTYDLLLKVFNLEDMNIDEQYDIVDIVLENILGEKASIELIKNVEIVKEFSDEYVTSQSNIQDLNKHLGVSI